MPACYRHADRLTRLSCGRCGKPLCPECVRHGPVGVRCRECLMPVRKEYAEFAAPQRTGLALAAGALLAIVWVGLFVWLGIRMAVSPEDFPLDLAMVATPNLLLSGVAGGLVGWVIWRICGRTCSRQTIIYALGFAAAIPLLSTVILAWCIPGMLNIDFHLLTDWPTDLRLLAAILISAFFALLLTTQIHWDGTVHLDG